jgi:hypothetical protein
MRVVGYIQLALLVSMALPVDGFAAEPLLFQFEQQAQQHCPGDSVVWAEAALQLYNVKGERWYGATKSGAYVCLRDGEKAGYRARRRTATWAGAE